VAKWTSVFAGQSNVELPFMYGDAVFDRDQRDLLLEGAAWWIRFLNGDSILNSTPTDW